MLKRKLNNFKVVPCDAFAQWLTAMHGTLTGMGVSEMNEQEFKRRFGLEGLGDSPDTRKDWSMPSVMCAALAGQPHLVKLCIEARCDVDACMINTEVCVSLPKGGTSPM